MSLLMVPKKRLKYTLIFTGSGIIGSWAIWRYRQKKQRIRFNDQINHAHERICVPEWLSEESDPTQGTTTTQDINQAQACVLYHPYVVVHSRDTCTPNHWHATYWLRFVALVKQEPIHAIVQRTDTKRYHLMVQLPVEDILPCDDRCSAHEVFRLPVRDHYAYFVFVPHQISMDLLHYSMHRRLHNRFQSLGIFIGHFLRQGRKVFSMKSKTST